MRHLRGEMRGMPLSPREHEVLLTYARLGSYKRVARRLRISVSTVNNTLDRVYEKTGTHRAVQALAFVLEAR